MKPPIGIPLPVEIWLYIASFFSDAELWSLRSLNHAFFQLAMDRHYERISVDLVGMRDDLRYCHSFGKLGKSHISPRVREVLLTTKPFYSRSPDADAHRRAEPGALRRFSQRAWRYVFRRGHRVTRAIGACPNVTSATVSWTSDFYYWPHCNDLPALDAAVPFIVGTIQALSERLTSLTISRIPLNYTMDMLSAATFPHLRLLHITFVAFTRNPPEGTTYGLSDVPVAFINRHKDTLQTLELHSFSRDSVTTLAPIFEGVDPLPRVTSIAVTLQRVDSNEIPAFQKLLTQQHDCLNGLDVHLQSNKLGAQSSLLEVSANLPFLRSLTIHPVGPVSKLPTIGQIVGFVKKYNQTLYRLEIIHQLMFQYRDWEAFSQSNWNYLQHLSLKLLMAIPTTFDCIAKDFPSLSHLELSVVFFGSDTDSTMSEGSQFREMMATRKYTSASLRDLVLSSPGSNQRCILVVARTFVSLRTINGVPWAEYLAKHG